MIKRTLAVLTAFMLMLTAFTACTPEETEEIVTEDVTTELTVATEDTTETLPTEEAVTELTAPTELPTHAEAEISEVAYNPTECSVIYEAEDGETGGYTAVMSSHEGYSGTGYVTGLSLPDSTLKVVLDIPSAQHYNVTVCLSSDEPVEGVLYVDGLARGTFTTSGSGDFESIKFENIYLSPETSSVTISDLSGEVDLDFFLLENTDDLSELDYSVSGVLSNSGATEATVELYKYLCEMYGESVLTAQQCSQGSNAEIYAVAAVTGKYPLIRLGELSGYSAGVDTGDIELAIEYYEDGGIIGYSWYWAMNGSCYLEESGFSLSNAVTTHDVAHMSLEKVEELLGTGGVSEECYAIIEGIDLIAEQFSRLAELDIPVIFRPLPEAGNGEFWWGEDLDSYIWLYELIYTRLTDYHMLDNIIWVWNAQDVEWYVGDEYCDIISLDVYDFSLGAWDNQSHVTALIRMMELTTDKPIAISECNILPSPANLKKDNAYWLFASVFSGSYAITEDYELCTDYMTEQEWILFYNCSETITK
ncbi:MAG: hypothetical protein LUH03_07980 [Oscillospiraceae bacterium]|nr:hypothetical protein [Oscillospiraceae bacterium]